MLRAENLGVRFGRRWVLEHLTFEVLGGQILAVLGPNGSGKSTLVRTLCGLQVPSTGRVTLPSGDLRHTVGYASLDMALYPDLTVEEHLRLTAALRGCEPKHDELLERVGLSYARSMPALHLSTGMRLRLKLALALQATPPVLLLDEPSASLDVDGRAMLDEVCKEQRTHGCVLIATNDPTERRIATHELVLA